MTHNELVAALKEWRRGGFPCYPERLVKALDAALDEYDKLGGRSLPYVDARKYARAAFLQSLTGPTTRETERP